MIPHLKPNGTMPVWLRLAVAVGVAVILVGWTVLRLGQTVPEDEWTLSVMVIGGALVLLADLFVLGRFPVREVWALYVLTVGFLIFGFTQIEQATFLGVLRALPAATDQIVLPSDPCQLVPSWGGSGAPSLSAADAQQAFAMELDLVAALGFWLTLAIVAAWSIRERAEHSSPARNPRR